MEPILGTLIILAVMAPAIALAVASMPKSGGQTHCHRCYAGHPRWRRICDLCNGSGAVPYGTWEADGAPPPGPSRIMRELDKKLQESR